MGFAQNLKFLMDHYDLTNYQLAKELNCSQTSVTNWLSGDSHPQRRTLAAIASKFDLTVEALCADTPPHIKGENRLAEVVPPSKKTAPAPESEDGLVNAIIIGRDGKAVKRTYTQEQMEALRKVLDVMPYLDDEEL